ncbi:MAG: UvrD-helicase domain-containing protein [Alphaproteobacteria bacterium]|nr:UvrD-helicase domain-containing protein [Alphaproteobacteria bacterium]
MTIIADQRRASNPQASVWVSASAGSGKTKVLTDRVLHLLLTTGRPDKLLCLTFTKAAAAEMENRIGQTLKNWVIRTDAELAREIEALTAEEPSPEQITLARQLFTRVLEVPGGMKIMTIHSFCQSILQRFPLEAGVPPNFDVIDDIAAKALLSDVFQKTLNKKAFQPDIAALAPHITERQLIDILTELFGSPNWQELTEQHSLETILHRIETFLGVARDETPESIVAAHFAGRDWEELKREYLTQQEEIRSVKKEDPAAQLVFQTNERLKELTICRSTATLLRVAFDVLRDYALLKRTRAVLDYADLIQHTLRLLDKSDMSAWVLFKLDGGLDHILVDEAQDTNPHQWRIIRKLAEEFFAGEGRSDTLRTLFAVGDKKQSIYSFQGADPSEFERMRQFFERRVRESQNAFENVPLNVSFRSTEPVLRAVNAVLKSERGRIGVLAQNEEAEHAAYRAQDGGLVEIWDPEIAPKTEPPAPWKPPVERVAQPSAISTLAAKIADTIRRMLDSGEVLASQNRPVRAGDFMILVQRRKDLANEIIRALKDRNIPVAGIDRLVLTGHLAIQDLIAAAQFVLSPYDDLNLACLLKSPLIGLGEEELYDLAQGRTASLWAAVRDKNADAVRRLKDLIRLARTHPTFEFFASILGTMNGRAQFAERMGDEVNEALDEFLTLLLHFEQSEIATLPCFLNWIQSQDIEIKRDLDQSNADCVRLMTVHGSKGLQGNIVFLPETQTRAPKKPNLIYLDKEIPLWLPNASFRTARLAGLYDALAREQEAENHRLLYVAMTRARDRLYICGVQKERSEKTSVVDNGWHGIIRDAVEQHIPDIRFKDGVWRLEKRQEKMPEQTPAETAPTMPPAALPSWATTPAPVEKHPGKPLSPSQIGSDDPCADSILAPGLDSALRRGTFIHRMLQYLPTLPPEKRAAVFRRMKPADLDVPDTLPDIFTHPSLPDIFGPGSMAEVPIVGVWNNKAISGQVDRLVVRENQVIVLDYKTNRIVPKRMPQSYKMQLGIYKHLLGRIFPDKMVKAYILWTEDFSLTEVADEV